MRGVFGVESAGSPSRNALVWMQCLGLRVEGSKFKIQDSGYRVQVQGLEVRVQISGLRSQSSGLGERVGVGRRLVLCQYVGQSCVAPTYCMVMRCRGISLWAFFGVFSATVRMLEISRL